MTTFAAVDAWAGPSEVARRIEECEALMAELAGLMLVVLKQSWWRRFLPERPDVKQVRDRMDEIEEQFRVIETEIRLLRARQTREVGGERN